MPGSGRAAGRIAGRLGRPGVAAVALALAGAAPAAGAIDGTELVSRASGAAGAPANSPISSSTSPSVSLDGRYVAVQSVATNLDPADTDAVSDIYVRDTATDTTTLVSRSTSGAKGNDDSDHPSISDDGRYVAFRSFADNLHPSDPTGNVESDVFVRDLQTNTTLLVSRLTGLAGAKTNGSDPSISADGRYVAFDSFGQVPPDDVTVEHDIHVRDLQLDTTTMVSQTTGGAPGSSNSFNPSISSSGRYVAFESQSTNFDAADTGLDTDIYVRDRQLGTTVLASRASGAGGDKADGNSGEPSMSDAPSVAFETPAGNLHPGDADGFDIFVRDLTSSTTALASRAGGADGVKGDGGSRFPSISADGRRVAFESTSANLAPPDTSAFNDIFVRDLQASTTTLASVATDGTPSNGLSHLTAISRDGGFAAFESSASNLGSNATGWQTFIRDVFAVPPDPGGGAPGGGGGPGGPGGGGGGAVGPPPAAATAPAKADLAGAKASLKVTKKGAFAFRFRAAPGLKGKAVFRSAKAVRIKTKRKRVTLASKAFTVPASGRVKLELKLSRANLRILRKNRKIRTAVSVTLTNAAALSSTASTTITLKR